MASYTTIEDWLDVENGYVINVTIRQTADQKHPCGWEYRLHFGEIGGDTILRYDNAHERTKGHERHAHDSVEIIEFHGMRPLYDRFRREIDELSPVSWDWPEEDAAGGAQCQHSKSRSANATDSTGAHEIASKPHRPGKPSRTPSQC